MRVYNILILILLISTSLFAVELPKPPTQPATGYGGKNYKYNQIKIISSISKGFSGYYIFEPKDYKNTMAPIIVFIHGWAAIKPYAYRLFIEHLVKQGYIVIYPTYQRLIALPRKFTEHTVKDIKKALNKLYTSDYIKPDISNFGIIGHSAGGVIAANIGVIAIDDPEIPQPKFILSIEPGITTIPPESRKAGRGRSTSYVRIPLLDLRKLPPSTYLITISCDEDTNVFDQDAKKIYSDSVNIPPINKAHLIIHSDYHGYPPLIADHLAPLSIPVDNFLSVVPKDNKLFNKPINRIKANALDYYGFWKIADMLIDISFINNKSMNLNCSTAELYMGKWSDGTNVKKISIDN